MCRRQPGRRCHRHCVEKLTAAQKVLMHLQAGEGADSAAVSAAADRVAVVATELAADSWQVTDTADRKTVVLMVSKEGHCLYELLSRWHSKEMRADVGVVPLPGRADTRNRHLLPGLTPGRVAGT